MSDNIEAQQFQVAKRKRTAYRGVVTRKLQTARQELACTPPDVDTLTVTLSQLLEAAKTLEQVTTTCYDYILSHTTDDDVALEETEECESYRDQVREMEILIRSAIGDSSASTKSRLSQPASVNLNDCPKQSKLAQPSKSPNLPNAHVPLYNIPTQAHFASSSTRLPKLSLPIFDGNIIEYRGFVECFEAAVHNRSDISDIEKFAYLRGQLRGEAAKIIHGFSLTSQNYAEARFLLDRHFGELDTIVRAHIRSLLEIKLQKNCLRDFANEVAMHIRSLSALNVSLASYEVVLNEVLLARLPEDIKIGWVRLCRRGSKSVEDLLDYLFEECRVRQLSSQCRDKPTYQTNSVSRVVSVERNIPAASVLTAHSDITADPKLGMKDQCVFCQGNHRISSCEKFSHLPLSERLDIVKAKGMCYNCFKQHKIAQCQSKSRCKKCHKKHHTLIHNDAYNQNNALERQQRANQTTEKEETENTYNYTSHSPKQISNSVVLPTARVVARGSDETRASDARILLDSGSQYTYIRKDLASLLRCDILGNVRLDIQTFSENSSGEQTLPIAQVTLTSRHDATSQIQVRAVVVDKLCHPLAPICVDHSALLQGTHSIALADDLGDLNGRSIEILIGCDHLNEVLTGNCIPSNVGALLVESKFGWVVQGTVATAHYQKKTTKPINTTVNFVEASCSDQNNTIEQFWRLESLGICRTEVTQLADEEAVQKYAMHHVVQDKSGRYVVNFPWKEVDTQLANNKLLALSRLKGLTKRLKADHYVLNQYDATFRGYLQQGIAQRVTLSNVEHTHYLPHHAVCKAEGTTKTRVVFDASCKDKHGVCLNDMMHTGPCLNPEILAILLRFRQHSIAYSADIEKAFLQISLAEADTHMVRFFWYDEDISEQWPTTKPVEYSMTRLIFGATSSPFILAAVLRHHADSNRDRFTLAASHLARNMYVDDFVGSSATHTEAVDLCHQTQQLLNEAQMKLRGWTTNSLNLLDSFDNSLTKNDAVTRVLGLSWDTQLDEIYCGVRSSELLIDSKRKFIKFIASLYDPLGLASPVVVKGKILLQSMWKMDMSWDSDLPDELRVQCQQWATDCEQIHTLPFRRAISSAESTNFEFRGYGDASQSAYCACVYLVSTTTEGIEQISLVAAKTRVAPVKTVSLPRLELLSALLVVRLINYVKTSLSVDYPVTLFLDSMIALGWIRGRRERQEVFVSNRVTEILKTSKPEQWYHIRSESNPADLGTRGLSLDQFKAKMALWTSPELPDKESGFDLEASAPIAPRLEPCEPVTNPIESQITLIVTNDTSGAIDIKRYSNLGKLLRVTSYCRRFLSNCKAKMLSRKNCQSNSTIERESLTTLELEQSLQCLIKSEQSQYYAKEINSLQTKEYVEQKSSINSLYPFINSNGILCVGGRLSHASLNVCKHPIILPKRSWLSELIIREAHLRLLHSGATQLVTDIRSRYWIPGLRDLTRKYIRTCPTCKRFTANPFEERFSPLPPERVQSGSESAFSAVGVDHCGPIYTKENKTTSKVYILLITCTRYRAVHLELSKSLNLEDFLMAFDRFKARRGIPSLVISDNAKTFKAAADRVSTLGVSWRFIADRSPWQGGFYERLVQTVKRPLRRILMNTSISYEKMRTLLCQIEAVVNSRPLTFVFDDVKEPRPLCPSHFVVSKSLTDRPLPTTDESDVAIETQSRQSLTRSLRYQRTLLSVFKTRWMREYLPELQRNARRIRGGTSIKAGDVVIVKETSRSRQTWPLGVVQSVIQGLDGRVRSVYVKVSKSVVRRGIQNLYPFEINESPNSATGM